MTCGTLAGSCTSACGILRHRPKNNINTKNLACGKPTTNADAEAFTRGAPAVFGVRFCVRCVRDVARGGPAPAASSARACTGHDPGARFEGRLQPACRAAGGCGEHKQCKRDVARGGLAPTARACTKHDPGGWFEARRQAKCRVTGGCRVHGQFKCDVARKGSARATHVESAARACTWYVSGSPFKVRFWPKSHGRSACAELK